MHPELCQNSMHVHVEIITCKMLSPDLPFRQCKVCPLILSLPASHAKTRLLSATARLGDPPPRKPACLRVLSQVHASLPRLTAQNMFPSLASNKFPSRGELSQESGDIHLNLVPPTSGSKSRSSETGRFSSVLSKVRMRNRCISAAGIYLSI